MKNIVSLSLAFLTLVNTIRAAPVEERCGPNFADHKCSNNKCCSFAGYCGTGREYCALPTICQPSYGRCNSDDIPPGPPTTNDKRPLLGDISYEEAVTRCSIPRTVAITFDDGPSNNTEKILDILREAGAKATFFISGNNNGKGEIDLSDGWRRIVQLIDAEGHQIASHTWTHADLDSLASKQRKDEMLRNERAIANIIARYPTYMRAPYIRCSQDSGCMSDMKALGYHVVNWSLDSQDALFPTDLEAMKKSIDAGIDKAGPEGGLIFVQHDTIPVSALEATKHLLRRIEEKSWKAVTVAECLGEPLQDAYRSKLPAGISIGPV